MNQTKCFYYSTNSACTNLFGILIGTGKKQKRETMKHNKFLFMFLQMLFTLRLGSSARSNSILSSSFVSELSSFFYYL